MFEREGWAQEEELFIHLESEGAVTMAGDWVVMNVDDVPVGPPYWSLDAACAAAEALFSEKGHSLLWL